MARTQGAQSQMAAAFETTYGLKPASGFKRMPYASSTLGAAQPLLANELLGYGRDPMAPQRDAITVEGDLTVPIDVESFAVWLKAAFGAPVSTDQSTKRKHVFKSGSFTLPSLSIEIGLPQVPHFALNSGCCVNTLNWTMQRAGLLTARVGLIGQGETIAAATQAGTVADFDVRRFGHFNGSVERNGAVIGNVVSADITYTNNLDRVEVIRGDGLIAGLDPAVAALSGRISVRFDSQVLMTQATNGDSCDLSFGYTLPTGESLTFDVPRVFLPRAKATVEGPAGVQVTFDWQAAQQANGDPMVTATLVNDVENY